MTDNPTPLSSLRQAAEISPAQPGLEIFADGGFEPETGQGGWAFVAYRNGVETASGAGKVDNSENNAMELVALLQAAVWIRDNAGGEAAVIWSDSVYAVEGCNSRRHIWKNNGWKKTSPNGKGRRRTIANADLWQAIDLALSQHGHLTIAWCRGHSGIAGNERADALAEIGRLSPAAGKRR
jgi:ribonuclease HI